MEHVGFDPKIAACLCRGDGSRFCIAAENYHDAAVHMINTCLGGDSDLDRLKMAMNIVFHMEADFLDNVFLQKCENCNVLEKNLGGGKKLKKCSACKTALYCVRAALLHACVALLSQIMYLSHTHAHMYFFSPNRVKFNTANCTKWNASRTIGTRAPTRTLQ